MNFTAAACAVVFFADLLGYCNAGEKPGASDFEFSVQSLQPREMDFALKQQRSFMFSFSVSHPCAVKLVIRDWDGDVIDSLSGNFKAGEQQFKWEPDANKLFDGVHTFGIEATNGNTVKQYAPTLETALDFLPIPKSALDYKTGEFTYTMPKMGMTRIRLLQNGKMLVRTLLEWTPQLAGDYRYIWDQKDQSGNPIRLNEGISIRMLTYTLPENAFIIKGIGKTKVPRPLQHQFNWQNNPSLTKKMIHARAPRETNRDPRLTLEAVGHKSRQQGPIEVSDKTQFRLRIHPDDLSYVTNERFEICICLDGTLLYEEEDGIAPYTFEIDPQTFNHGNHLLTVNLITTGDQIGAASLALVTKKNEDALSKKIGDK